MKSPRFADEVPRARTLAALDFRTVFAAVSEYFHVDQAIIAQRGDGHIARAAAAWLSRRLTTATLRELSVPLGLSQKPDARTFWDKLQKMGRNLAEFLPRD